MTTYPNGKEYQNKTLNERLCLIPSASSARFWSFQSSLSKARAHRHDRWQIRLNIDVYSQIRFTLFPLSDQEKLRIRHRLENLRQNLPRLSHIPTPNLLSASDRNTLRMAKNNTRRPILRHTIFILHPNPSSPWETRYPKPKTHVQLNGTADPPFFKIFFTFVEKYVK